MDLNQFRDVDLVIDKANDSFIQRQFVSQGDYKGRTLTVQVTNNGVIDEVLGLTLNLRWQNQASGLTDLSAFNLIDRANSIFRIEFPQHMMTPGTVIASIQVLHDGKSTFTKQFQLTVQKLAGEPVGIVEKAEFSALVAVLSDSNKFRTDIDGLDATKASKAELISAENSLTSSIGKKVDKNGNEQITMPMLAQEVKVAMTGGSVAVVGPDGVNTTNLVNRSVTVDKVKGYLIKGRLIAGNKLPNYDTKNKTLTFYGISKKDDYLLLAYENWQFNYTIPNGLVLVAEGISSYGFKLVFNLTEKKLRLIAWSTRITDDEVTIALIQIGSANPYVVGETQITIDGRISEIFRNQVEIGSQSNSGNENFRSIAHQGYNNQSPGNVIESFKLAKKNGFYYVETDIKKTSDGVFVLCHDNDINTVARNPDGTQIAETMVIAEHTFDELYEYDFGIKYGNQYAGIHMAKLEDLLILCKKHNMHPYLEIKIDSRNGVAKEIVDLIKKVGMQNDVTFISTNIVMLAEFVDLLAKTEIGWVTSTEVTTDNINNLKAYQSDKTDVFFDINHLNLSENSLKLMQAENIDYEIWTVDDRDIADSFVALGVRGITTNRVNFNQIWNEDL